MHAAGLIFCSFLQNKSPLKSSAPPSVTARIMHGSWIRVGGLLPLSECGVAALPAGGLLGVVVVDVLLAAAAAAGGAGGGAAAAGAAARLHRSLLALVGVRGHGGAGGQVGVVGVVGVGGVELRSHLLLLLLVFVLLLLAQGQSQDLIAQREPAHLLGLLQAFREEEQVGQTPHDPAMMEQPAVRRGHGLNQLIWSF